jgi:hypothetical protein
MKKEFIAIGLVLALIVGTFGLAYGTSGILATFNTQGGTAVTTAFSCGVCHTSVPSLNPFGNDYLNSGLNLSPTLRDTDSDGDGYTNIAEINAVTNPGDRNSHPAPVTDTTVPTVSAFTIPATSTSLTVGITSFAATDNVGVTGYMVTTSSTAPADTATGWTPAAPTSYTFSSAGANTLYAWAKDAAGNVSAPRSTSVTITPPTTTTVVTLTKSGAGSGTVTSSPLGINCGGTCSASYASNAAVTLIARADADSYFAGWSAPCSGISTCNLTLTADTQVTAIFAPGYFDTVQGVYIGYYQRPADPGGLLYWADRLESTNGNLNEIIEAYASSPESQALYGTINSNNISDVVNRIYNALFGRDAETGGLNYYTNGFSAGQFTAATIMLNVLYGAQNEDLRSINNKLAAANLFTRTIDPELDGANFQVTYAGEQDAIAARTFLVSVTENPATVPTQDETTVNMKSYIADSGDPILNH